MSLIGTISIVTSQVKESLLPKLDATLLTCHQKLRMYKDAGLGYQWLVSPNGFKSYLSRPGLDYLGSYSCTQFYQQIT